MSVYIHSLSHFSYSGLVLNIIFILYNIFGTLINVYFSSDTNHFQKIKEKFEKMFQSERKMFHKWTFCSCLECYASDRRKLTFLSTLK